MPLPFLLAYDVVPYFSRLWWPQRFELLAWLGLAVLVALATDALLRRMSTARMAIGPAVLTPWDYAASLIVTTEPPPG